MSTTALPARVPAPGHPPFTVPRRSRTAAHSPHQSSTTSTSVARDSQIIGTLTRQTLFCGAEQPFTAGYVNQASSAPLNPSLYIQNSSPRDQLAPQTNGCGTQIHASALPSGGSVWLADTLDISDTVIPIEARYVPREALGRLDRAQREVCGCETQFVGCAVCGNPLGTQLTPCPLHPYDSGGSSFAFLASAVSPPLPPTAEDTQSFLRRRHSYVPDGRRIPSPPPLPPLRARGNAPITTTADTEREHLRARILAHPHLYASLAPEFDLNDNEFLVSPPNSNANTLDPLPTGLFRHDAAPPMLPFDADANAARMALAQVEAMQAQADTQITMQERQAQHLRMAQALSIQAQSQNRTQLVIQQLREHQEEQAQRWERFAAAQRRGNTIPVSQWPMPGVRADRGRGGGLEEGATTRVLRVGRTATHSGAVTTTPGGQAGVVGGGGGDTHPGRMEPRLG
ncbi:hypothetical protein C8R46DRAFT_1349439 [Mycena filopes]|nr:hypothetical protein C8R46DRAFT_1349439 [Mycena filopes]